MDLSAKYRVPDDLPTEVPIFPLGGALLLPRAHLPLNIFEPRYLKMVDDAMRGDRIIGSTVVALVVEGSRAACVWVGDSRCYLWRGQRLYQLSRDHSLLQRLVDERRMDIEQARLLTLQAAHVMDTQGMKAAIPYISMVKIVGPNMAQQVADRAMQVFGGMGVCQDTLIPEVS